VEEKESQTYTFLPSSIDFPFKSGQLERRIAAIMCGGTGCHGQ
jgi:hypothetical protein